MKRLCFIASHPIQYHVPWLQAMASHPGLDLDVYFCHQATPEEQSDAGFGVKFDWDIPLLDGYSHSFLANVAKKPSIASFGGLDTPEIKHKISRRKFDAVIVNGWHFKSAWQAIISCWRTKTPVMVRSDSHLRTQRSLLKKTLKHSLYRSFIPRFDACLAVGSWSSEYFIKYGADPSKVFIVPHVVDNDRYARESTKLLSQRVELREKWGLKGESIVFLFSGKFVEQKRPIDFIKAVEIASREYPRIVGLMVGDGSLRCACEGFAHDIGAPVKFTGFLNQSQIIQAYSVADALVLPSAGETWGMVVNEAMACGRPCIVSDQVGSAPDLIDEGITGSVFSVGDVRALANLIVSYAADEARLRKMGNAASAKIARNSVDAAVEGVIKALDRMTDRGKNSAQK